MNQGGVGSQLVGGLVVGMMGVLVIAGIYQLNKPQGQLVPAGQTVATSTLSAIFK